MRYCSDSLISKHVHCFIISMMMASKIKGEKSENKKSATAGTLSTLADAGGCGKGCWCHCCIETGRCLGLRTVGLNLSFCTGQVGLKHHFFMECWF